MPQYKHFEALLKGKGITAYEVGKTTKITQSTFSMWKSGKIIPKRDKLEKIADYFNVPIEYFYTGELLQKPKENFSPESLMLAREITNSDKLELIKDIIKIQEDKEVKMIENLVKIFLEKR